MEQLEIEVLPKSDKYCRKCHTIKDINNFTKCSGIKSGLKSSCKDCVMNKNKLYYESKMETKRLLQEVQAIIDEPKEKPVQQKYVCDCGGKYTHHNKTTHFKTKTHIKFVEINK